VGASAKIRSATCSAAAATTGVTVAWSAKTVRPDDHRAVDVTPRADQLPWCAAGLHAAESRRGDARDPAGDEQASYLIAVVVAADADHITRTHLSCIAWKEWRCGSTGNTGSTELHRRLAPTGASWASAATDMI
jgi:hypothetical protein